MAPNPVFEEIAYFTYYFFGLISLQVITSLFYRLDNSTIRARNYLGGNAFRRTSPFIISIVIIAFSYYVAERLFKEQIIEELIQLEKTLLPLSILSVSFFAFYATKVWLGRRWRFHTTMITLAISLLSLGFSILMYYNNNELIVFG